MSVCIAHRVCTKHVALHNSYFNLVYFCRLGCRGCSPIALFRYSSPIQRRVGGMEMESFATVVPQDRLSSSRDIDMLKCVDNLLMSGKLAGC